MANAGGAVSPVATADFQRALALDPKAPGSALPSGAGQDAGRGDMAGGLAGWRALLADLDPADPRRQSLAADIAQVQAAGRLPGR